MRKLLYILTAGLFLTFIVLVLRLSGGAGDGRPLYRSYRSENITAISSPEGDWTIEKRDDRWIWDNGEISLPARNSAAEALVKLPGELKKHPAGSAGGSEEWLPDSSLTLIYRANEREVLRLPIHVGRSPLYGRAEGFYTRGGRGQIYFHRLAGGEVPPWQNLISTRVFPETLAGGDIRYIRLYTPREGAEALQFRYELEKEGDNWNYRGELPEGNLKEAELNLLLLRIASLEGDFIAGEVSEDRDLRFRLEIHDNRGNRYVLNAGDPLQREGTAYYPVRLEGSGTVYYMTREKLSAVARPLSSLWEN